MAQKNKVKELVGRGLNSYHTKSLQQMNRIEKKNKEQNHKISILSNELDNDYLTKTEEGSVISLEHSKEGMVYLDELQGNTLVNYCVDGAKEFTLNDDINEFGTAVKLTETVDDGQVDVLAEGNTMVNVCDQQEAVAITKSYTVETGNHIPLQGEFDGKARPVPTGNTLVNLIDGNIRDKDISTAPNISSKFNYKYQLKTNTTYTLFYTLKDIVLPTDGANNVVYISTDQGWMRYGETRNSDGCYKFVFTTGDDTSNCVSVVAFYASDTTGGSGTISDIILLEGDYTNKPIPDYFTGIQSSFEDKVVTQEMVDNGEELAENLGKYRVDYKVTGKNKFETTLLKSINGSSIVPFDGKNCITFDRALNNVKVLNYNFIPNCQYVLKYNIYYNQNDGSTKRGNYIRIRYTDGTFTYPSTYAHNSWDTYVLESKKDKTIDCLEFSYGYNASIVKTYIDLDTIQLEEGSTATAYEPYKESIKTYYLNSPLLEGDTIEEINGNVYHVHRYKEVVLDGSSFNREDVDVNGIHRYFSNDYICPDYGLPTTKCYCDKLPIVILSSIIDGCITFSGSGFIEYATTKSLSEAQEWLNENPTTMVYKLQTPTYELISQSDTILTDSYVAGHLDFDTVVPVEKVMFRSWDTNVRYLYPNTTYDIQFESDNKGIIEFIAIGHNDEGFKRVDIIKGLNKFTLDTNNNPTTYIYTSGIGFFASNIVVTEATDKDFGYFAGMKSVGELEENKIEILSQNKNLIHTVINYNNTLDRGVTMTMENNNTLHLNGTTTNANGDLDYTLHNSEQMDVYLKPNRNYIVNFEVVSGSVSPIPSNAIKITDLVTGKVEWRTVKDSNRVISSSSNPRIVSWIRLAYSNITTFNNYKYRVQIEEGNVVTPYTKGLLNKKEISLNEPLRSLPNGVKDKVVKIGDKYYVERNCGEIDLSTINEWKSWGDKGTEYYGFYQYVSGLSRVVNESEVNVCCPTRPCIRDIEDIRSALSAGVHAGMGEPFGYIAIGFKRSELTELTSNGVKEWLSKNPTKVVAQLETPIYEELPIDLTINTYIDITHISNNSTIPCNMVVKNSGYNAIIKPSTLYTVALDTDKSGTIGINLGGAKVATTNNVATITTPATLTDDSLRLHGKGIKASKVRLLEGDKTNWIPSHFEGMKSCFEDKLQDDGTYKMEILSNNENLFNINEFVKGYSTKDIVGYVENGVRLKSKGWAGHERIGFKVEPYTTYKVTFTIKKENDEVTPNFEIYESNTTTASYFWTTSVGTHTRTFTTKGNTEVFIRMDTSQLGYSEYSNVSISKISSNFVPQQSNKIQFSSIEPLRSVEDTKDKFVFKDGKLVIERNIGQYLVNGNESWFVSGNDVYFNLKGLVNNFAKNQRTCITSKYPNFNQPSTNAKGYAWWGGGVQNANGNLVVKPQIGINTVEEYKAWVRSNNYYVTYIKEEPTYEEVPFELQKIILEGYENGTLFFDTNIPPTSTVAYAGETPIVKSVKLNKTEVLNNTNDINDNIIPYLMDMDYRVVCLQLATEEIEGGVSMARLFGGAYEMLKRDILSKRLSRQEYGYRLADYFNAGKLTEEQVRELEGLR